jgi:hypothetical protein
MADGIFELIILRGNTLRKNEYNFCDCRHQLSLCLYVNHKISETSQHFRNFRTFPKLRNISQSSQHFRNLATFPKLRSISETSQHFQTSQYFRNLAKFSKNHSISETSQHFRNFATFPKLHSISETSEHFPNFRTIPKLHNISETSQHFRHFTEFPKLLNISESSQYFRNLAFSKLHSAFVLYGLGLLDRKKKKQFPTEIPQSFAPVLSLRGRLERTTKWDPRPDHEH